MKYITTEETKILHRRVVKLAYFYAKQAIVKKEDKEDAERAFEVTNKIEEELQTDIKYENHMQRITYNVMMNIFDEIQNDRDEEGYFNLPYDLPYALNAVWSCL